jgi:hypothetical protein
VQGCNLILQHVQYQIYVRPICISCPYWLPALRRPVTAISRGEGCLRDGAARLILIRIISYAQGEHKKAIADRARRHHKEVKMPHMVADKIKCLIGVHHVAGIF